MTVETSTRTAIAYGNGATTVFPFNFPVLAEEHLSVVKYRTADNALIHTYTNGEYIVTGIGNDEGGSVTILGAPIPSGYKLVIQRTVPYTQLTDLNNQAGFYPETVEQEFDLLEMQIQQLNETSSRALTVPLGETVPSFPPAAMRAQSIAGFDGLGNPTTFPSSELGSIAVIAQRAEYVAEAGQTEFPTFAEYRVGYVSVFVNGAKLSTSEFDATNGTSVILGFPAAAHDVVSIEAFLGSTTALDAGSISYNPAGGIPRTVEDKLREIVTPQDFGAVGDNIANDTSAFVAMFAAGHRNIYVPPGVYKLDGLELPSACRFIGSGADTVLNITNPSNVAMTITAANFTEGGGPYEIGSFSIIGEADTAILVDTALLLNMHDISLYADETLGGFTGLNGFIFERTFGSTISSIRTNGATLSNACFIVGSAFNSNTCINWYTSNYCLHGLYMDQFRNGATAPGHGSIWINLCCQSMINGIYARSYTGATFKCTYTEDVVHPVTLGNAAASQLCRGFVFEGGDFAGPYTSGSIHPNADERRAVFDIDNATGVEIRGMDFSGAYNCGAACPLTITGDGSGAFAVARVYYDGGIWKVHSVEVVCEGTGYTTATVTPGGTGTGATFTATLDSGKIASIAVNNAGSGYIPINCPVAVSYNKAYRISIGSIFFNSGFGEQSPLYPWIVRKAAAEIRAGVTIHDDISWRGTETRLGSAELRKVSTSVAYQHVLIDSDELGAERRTLYTPPAYV